MACDFCIATALFASRLATSTGTVGRAGRLGRVSLESVRLRAPSPPYSAWWRRQAGSLCPLRWWATQAQHLPCRGQSLGQGHAIAGLCSHTGFCLFSALSISRCFVFQFASTDWRQTGCRQLMTDKPQSFQLKSVIVADSPILEAVPLHLGAREDCPAVGRFDGFGLQITFHGVLHQIVRVGMGK